MKIKFLSGVAFFAALSGQCFIYSAGADPPPTTFSSDSQSSALNAPDPSNSPSRPAVPALRFKKEDFVPIPEMAPIPLDNPVTPEKKPLKVNLPNSNEAQPHPRAYEAMARKPQPIATSYQRSNFTETPIPNGTVQAVPIAAIGAQELRPPSVQLSQITPLLGLPPSPTYGDLSPAAGNAATEPASVNVPLISLSDAAATPVATKSPTPVIPKPPAPLAQSAPAPAPLSTGEPLIALPGSTPAPAPSTAQATAPATVTAAVPNAVAQTSATTTASALEQVKPLPPVIAKMPEPPVTAPAKPLPAIAAATPPPASPVAKTEPAPALASPPAASVKEAQSLPVEEKPDEPAAKPKTSKHRATASKQTPADSQAVASLFADSESAPLQPLPSSSPLPTASEVQAAHLLPWQNASVHMSLPDPSTFGASALPPAPTILAGPVGSPTLPSNIPANAIQHWNGPAAIPATATHTLPVTTPTSQKPVQMAAQPHPPQAPAKLLPSVTPATPQPPVQPLLSPQPAEPMQVADSTEPQRALSPASKQILSRLNVPAERNREPGNPVFIEHARDLTTLDQKPEANAGTPVTRQPTGVKIEIKPPAINFDYELEKAYNALIAGQSEVAIATYKNVLANDSDNKNALFGLATTYHRTGQLELARPFYSHLLTIDPNNTDGLNNFLVLLSDEAPEEALAELIKLAQRNPQYSALPAQIAVIYQKLGQYDKASQYMFQAIEMAPENVTYRYNFAIMLDKQHKYDEAAKLYRQLIQASQRGETIPGNIQKIQQRLTFISSNRPS